MTENSEWPKSWTDIKNDAGDSGLIAFDTNWIEYQDGMRGYKGTLYVSSTVGSDTDDNADEWMPFDVYIEEKVNERSDK